MDVIALLWSIAAAHEATPKKSARRCQTWAGGADVIDFVEMTSGTGVTLGADATRPVLCVTRVKSRSLRPTWTTMFRKLRAVVKDEIGGVGLRRPLAHLLIGLLPRSGFMRTRNRIYRAAGYRNLHKTTSWFGLATLTGDADRRHNLITGRVVRFNHGCMLNVQAEIRIGDNVGFGHEVMILTESHGIGAADYRSGERFELPVTVRDGCWVGARTTIMPGVTIGEGSVIGAHSLVTGDIPPNVLAHGVPARVVRSLDVDEVREKLSDVPAPCRTTPETDRPRP